jgi:hypothetical protein
MRELFDVEKHGQIKVGELGDPTKLTARAMTAVAWALRRRSEPDLTFGDALEMTMEEVNKIIAGAESGPLDPPTPNGSESLSPFSVSPLI